MELSLDSREIKFQNNYPWYNKLLEIYNKLIRLKKENTLISIEEFNILKNRLSNIDTSLKWIDLKEKIREYRKKLYEDYLFDDTIYGNINTKSKFFPTYYQLTYDFQKLEILEWYYKNLSL